MKLNRKEILAFGLLVVVMMLWTGNSIVARALRHDVPPFTLALLRWTGACLVLSPFAMGPLKRDWAQIRAGWKSILLLSMLGIGAFNALIYSGLRYTTASNALLLQAAIPAMVLLFDRLFYGVHSVVLQKAGVILSALGVAIIVFQGDLRAALNVHLGYGDLLVLISALVWSLYTVLVPHRPKISAISFVATTFVLGIPTMLPFAMHEWSQGELVNWKPGVIAGVAYISVLPSLVAFTMFNWSTQVLGSARSGQTLNLLPLFGALFSAALLGEKLHGYHLVGMSVILIGIGIAILAMRDTRTTGTI